MLILHHDQNENSIHSAQVAKYTSKMLSPTVLPCQKILCPLDGIPLVDSIREHVLSWRIASPDAVLIIIVFLVIPMIVPYPGERVEGLRQLKSSSKLN
jgi:hypothetical protein